MNDIISLCNYEENELRDFSDHINTNDRYLQFTSRIEIANRIPFLGVLIIRSRDKPNFTIYRKPTQNNRYLHFKSNHPPHKLKELS